MKQRLRHVIFVAYAAKIDKIKNNILELPNIEITHTLRSCAMKWLNCDPNASRDFRPVKARDSVLLCNWPVMACDEDSSSGPGVSSIILPRTLTAVLYGAVLNQGSNPREVTLQKN